MFNEALLAAMVNLLIRYGCPVDRVTGYEEVEKSGGYCETCYYEWTEVRIDYLAKDGSNQSYNYYGDFGELIRELTNE